jgi:thioesterase domain-containing protein/acyl carrier protein
MLTVLPLCHMNAVTKLLATIFAGASGVLASGFNLDRYWQWAMGYDCTWLSLVPSLIAQLVSREAPDIRALGGIRYARSSSAPLPDAHRELFEAKFGIPIREAMGMTEAGTVFMNPPPPGSAKPGSVGIARGFELKILDLHGKPLPCGQSGSVWVRGAAIMQGYYGDREMTAKALDPDGWLNTGDVGLVDNDGYVFLTGRTKEIIIKSGVNIAPREIDEVLTAHPSVQEAATVGIADSILGEDILSYVVLRPGAHCEPDELIEVCRKQLGTLKTPRRICIVDDLPRGPSGKVQPLQLTPMRLERPQGPRSDKPATLRHSEGIQNQAAVASLARITELWSEVLKRKGIKIDEDFFAIGGTSLLATELLLRLEREFAVELSLEDLLFYPTVLAQAQLLDRAVSRVRRAFLLAPVREGCRQPPLFCIHGVALYRALAVALGPEQPTYGLSPNLIIDLRTAQAQGRFTLGEIAERYLAAVREIQPRGPYYLVGFSFGGRVALEIARRLRAASEHVALLSVVDTYLCCTGWRYRLHWFGYHLGEFIRNGPRHLVDLISRAQKLRRPEVRATQVEAEIRRRARTGYRAQPYPGDIALFRAVARYAPAYSMDEFLGWRDVTQGTLDVHDIPGDHYSMLNPPNVQALAEKLRAYMPRPS